jgi:hypothetical protein
MLQLTRAAPKVSLYQKFRSRLIFVVTLLVDLL